MSDTTLWSYIDASDKTAIVGLKAPGLNRGFWHGELLLDRSQWNQAGHAVAAQRGVTLISADTLLPTIKVRLENIDALRAVRKLPIVDYIQPVSVATGLGQLWASSDGSSGCDFGSTWTAGGYPTASGDAMSAPARAMGIEDAWRRSNGAGVTIGLTDTGLSSTQPELADPSVFASGESGGRFIQYLYTSNTGTPWSSCGHGTKMAGAIAAPRNGKNAVGVAWKANLISVHQANGVTAVSSDAATEAIRRAAQNMYFRNGGKIIAMAWESVNFLYQVSDEIQYWYYNFPIFFIAAAGSDPGPFAPNGNVTFPADQKEVFAVTGVDYPSGQICPECHYGSPVQLAAYAPVQTTGQNAGDLVAVGQSSGATAVIAGVAALIWSRYPSMTRDQLWQRLRESGSLYPTKDGNIGWGIVNAHKALGGMWYVSLGSCGNKTDCTLYYKLAMCTTKTYYVSRQGGDGPFTYRWNTGSTGTSASITLCPDPGRIAYYSINVTATDQSDGTSIYRTASIEVTSSDPDGACPTCPK